MADELLQAAVSDREKYPWRYYKFDRDELLKGLDYWSDRARAAEAKLAALQSPLAHRRPSDGG
jgi:hypothetical protein